WVRVRDPSRRRSRARSESRHSLSGLQSHAYPSAPAPGRPARRTHQQERKRKADGASDHNRTQRILPDPQCESFRAIAERVAAIFIGLLRVVGRRVRCISCHIFRLTIQILGSARCLPSETVRLSVCVTSDVADGTFDLTNKILCRTGNPIFVHGATSSKFVL